VIDALVEVLPVGAVVLGALLVLFAVGAGKAIDAMDTEPPGFEPATPRGGPPAQVPHLAWPVESRGSGLDRVGPSIPSPCPRESPVRHDEGRSLHVLRAVPDNAAPRAVADPGRRQDDHHLIHVEEHRDGSFSAHCSCLSTAHGLPTHAACDEWIIHHGQVLAELEARIEAFAPRGQR